jgi:hypothetical protein
LASEEIANLQNYPPKQSDSLASIETWPRAHETIRY